MHRSNRERDREVAGARSSRNHRWRGKGKYRYAEDDKKGRAPIKGLRMLS